MRSRLGAIGWAQLATTSAGESVASKKKSERSERSERRGFTSVTSASHGITLPAHALRG